MQDFLCENFYNTGMRYFLIVIGLLSLPLCAAPADEPEIVIELTGTPDKQMSDGVDIWDKDAKQLTRLFSGKTREKALALITSVSTKDANVLATDGTKYRFVQYGREGGYRKFLFQAKEPQTFVAVATDTQEALSLAKRYQVDIHISETEFLDTYGTQTSSVFLPAPNGQTLYQTEINQKTPEFFLFEQGRLVRRLSKEQADQLVQTQQETARKQAQTPKTAPPKKPYKALLYGGTVHDQMYMPRVIQRKPSETVKSSK